MWICILSAHSSVQDILSAQLNELCSIKHISKGGRGKVPCAWETSQNKWCMWAKAQGQEKSACASESQTHGVQEGKWGAESWKKMFFTKRISKVSELPSGCPADLVFRSSLPASNKLCTSHRLSSECPISHICTAYPSSAITNKAAEFSTYYLVSKVFPSVLPLCNSVSLMLTAKMAWCPDVDETSESGALKSVPALWKCAGRCDNDWSLAYILEHSKALNKNSSHLWSICLALGIVLSILRALPHNISIRNIPLLFPF